jgi:hypothetical protein
LQSVAVEAAAHLKQVLQPLVDARLREPQPPAGEE